jgi:hypothetical protein
LSIAELCAHAIELKRAAALQAAEYARRMRAIDAPRVAAAFESQAREQRHEIAALEAAAGARPPAELSPWEFVWRLTYLPDALEYRPRLVPLNAREALQLAIVARRRAEAFYNDVAAHGADGTACNCAAELAGGERWRLRRLEQLLEEIPA